MIGKSQLSNTNKLIKYYKGATGLKTGSTGLALYNLSASATRDNLSLIAVIMKAPSTKVRFAEAQKLLDYGFNSFSFKELGKKDDVVKTLNVNKGIKSSVEAVLSDNVGTLLEKGKDKNIEQILLNNEEYEKISTKKIESDFLRSSLVLFTFGLLFLLFCHF